MRRLVVLLVCLGMLGCGGPRIYSKKGLEPKQFSEDVNACSLQKDVSFDECMKAKGYARK